MNGFLTVPGKAAVISAVLQSQRGGEIDLREMIRELKIFQSMMRPYLVVDMSIIDRNNFGNEVQIVGGEPCVLKIANADSDILELKLQCVSQKNELMSNTLRAQGSTISMAGEAYFQDQTSKIQMSFRHTLASDAIAKIAKMIGISKLKIEPTKNFLGEREPYIIQNKRALAAIDAIRSLSTGVKNPATGALAFFADTDGTNLLSLATAMQSPIMDKFVQDGTIGKDAWKAVEQLKSQVIGFQGGTSFSGGAGSAAPAAIAGSRNPVTHTLDTGEKKYNRGLPKTMNFSFGNIIPLGSGLNNLLSGSVETALSFVAHDPRLNRISPVAEKAGGERFLGYLLQNGGSFTCAVLFDRGMKLNVGRKVDVLIPPPIGDQTSPYGGKSTNRTRLGGEALIVNLVHHIKNYDTYPQGITILECSQGGIPS